MFATEGNEDDEGEEEDEVSGRVVPGVHGRVTSMDPEEGEDEGSGKVEQKGKEETAEDEEESCGEGTAVEFADKEGGHEIGLEGTDAGAGFINADGALGEFNEVALLDGDMAEPVERFDTSRGHPPHEGGDDGSFKIGGPGYGQEEEGGRKGKVAKPGTAAESQEENG